MIVAPGFNAPDSSAPLSIHRATRSFTLPAGFKYSSLHSSRQDSPLLRLNREASNKGVLPTSSVRSRAIFPMFPSSSWVFF